MLKLLVPVDGSEPSNRAVDYLVKKVLNLYKERPEVHLLNVQHSLSGDVTMFIDREELHKFHHEEGLKALAPARAKLDSVGLSYVVHVSVGDPAHVINHFAHDKKCDQIFMGARGLGGVASALIGSVTSKVLHLTDVPVLIVK